MVFEAYYGSPLQCILSVLGTRCLSVNLLCPPTGSMILALMVGQQQSIWDRNSVFYRIMCHLRLGCKCRKFKWVMHSFHINLPLRLHVDDWSLLCKFFVHIVWLLELLFADSTVSGCCGSIEGHWRSSFHLWQLSWSVSSGL